VPERQAVAEMLAAGVQPLQDYPGVNERWRSRCLAENCPGPANRIVYPRLGWVRRGAQACKWCAGVVIDPLTAHDIMVNQAGLLPQVPYPGVREPWKCRCLHCQSIVSPTLGSVTGRGTRCSECGENGFQRSQPGLLYLVTHERMHAAKVGVCNLDTGRIEKHERRGWVRYALLSFTVGRQAELLEKQALAEWRSQGWDPVLDGERRYDGWTETVSLSVATADGLWQGILDLYALTRPRRTPSGARASIGR